MRDEQYAFFIRWIYNTGERSSSYHIPGRPPKDYTLPNGLVLLNVVVDIERVGDYTKNILDLAMNHPKKIISENISSDLHDIEQEIIERFNKTILALDNQDQKLALKLLKTYKNNLASKSDLIVNDCISGKSSFEDNSKTTSVALYARYLKRVGAHLKNITTTIVNPFEYIGYKPPS